MCIALQRHLTGQYVSLFPLTTAHFVMRMNGLFTEIQASEIFESGFEKNKSWPVFQLTMQRGSCVLISLYLQCRLAESKWHILAQRLWMTVLC